MEENLTFFKINKNLKEIFGLRFNKQVAERLGMTEDSYKQRKRDESIPFKEIIFCCDKEGWSPNWIFWNEGPKRRANINNEGVILSDQIKELISFLEDKGPLIESLLLLLKERVLPNKENLVQVGGNENPR